MQYVCVSEEAGSVSETVSEAVPGHGHHDVYATCDQGGAKPTELTPRAVDRLTTLVDEVEETVTSFAEAYFEGASKDRLSDAACCARRAFAGLTAGTASESADELIKLVAGVRTVDHVFSGDSRFRYDLLLVWDAVRRFYDAMMPYVLPRLRIRSTVGLRQRQV